MPVGQSPSCSSFAVSSRKVPSLALVPRGHLKHAPRVKKRGTSDLHTSQIDQKAREEASASPLTQDFQDEVFIASPTHLPRRSSLADSLQIATEEIATLTSPARRQKAAQDEELRLGERFLNMMAFMAQLAIQPLDNEPPGPKSPGPKSPVATERLPSPTRTCAASPLKPAKPPAKSPKHTIREVSKRLPRALQSHLTFDICVLLPEPMNGRQSPLRSPIRRKRLRKRGRRKLKRRPRRTWQASYTSWQPYASVDYIVEHARQDIAGINAARLVERLGEHKTRASSLPRVISMPLPALNRDDHHQVARSTTTVSAAKEELVSGLDSDEEEEYDDEDDEDHDQEDANEDDEDKEELQGSVQREDEATPLESDKPAAIAASSPRKPLEPEVDSSPAQTKKRPLYHQPAWISPELHAWLVASGLFATKPRCELLPSEV